VGDLSASRPDEPAFGDATPPVVLTPWRLQRRRWGAGGGERHPLGGDAPRDERDARDPARPKAALLKASPNRQLPLLRQSAATAHGHRPCFETSPAIRGLAGHADGLIVPFGLEHDFALEEDETLFVGHTVTSAASPDRSKGLAVTIAALDRPLVFERRFKCFPRGWGMRLIVTYAAPAAPNRERRDHGEIRRDPT
jgi:hypothetical protein